MKSIIYLQLLALISTNCGGSSKASSSPDSIQTPSNPIMTMTLDTAAELPICDKMNEHQLVYVVETKQFQSCKKGIWTVINIQGTDGKDGQAGKDGVEGLRITKIWEYMDNAYTTDDYLNEGNFALIGDIRLMEFSDGAYQVYVNGQTLLSEASGDLSVNDFSHSFFLPKGKSIEAMKLTSYADVVIYYNLNVKSSGPELDIAINTDNNFDNDVSTTYILENSWAN